VERAAPVRHCFRFAASWRPIGLLVGAGAGLVVIGWVLLLLNGFLPSASWWLVVVRMGVVLVGGAAVIAGVSFLGLGLWVGFVRLLRAPVVRTTNDGLRIAHLGWRSVCVPFAELKWARREQPENGTEYVVLVYGPALETESVGRGEIGTVAYETLLALLAERCPDCFAPDPPAGWRMPY
jgi:hypothetical protein